MRTSGSFAKEELGIVTVYQHMWVDLPYPDRGNITMKIDSAIQNAKQSSAAKRNIESKFYFFD
jgi:hypothetical protein